MSDLWLALLPIAVAMAIVPGRFLAIILIFHTERAVLTALSFVGGMASTMLIEGFVFALLFSATGIFSNSESEGPPAIIATLFIVIGLLMLVSALKMIFQEDDEEKAPPKWLEEIESFTPGKAYKLGFGWLFISPKQWIFTLTAVAVIFSANLSTAASLVNYLIFIFIVLLLFFVLILIYVAFPQRAAAILDKLFVWLKANARTIIIVVFVGFGLYFLVNGVASL